MALRRARKFAAALACVAALPGCGGLFARPQPDPAAQSTAVDTAAYVAACELGCANAAACLGDPHSAEIACVAECAARAERVVSSTCAAALEREATCFAELDCAGFAVYFGADSAAVGCSVQDLDVAAACGVEP